MHNRKGYVREIWEESGADGTRRRAQRLKRMLLRSGVMEKKLRPRVSNMVAPWPARQYDTRVSPGRGRAARQQKNRRPGQGTSGVKLVVPPHFAAACDAATSPRTARRRAMRRLGNGSRFALPGARRRLLRQICVMPVGGGARRSFSPAFLVPLRSDRGSLARSRRLLVLVMASLCGCARTVTGT